MATAHHIEMAAKTELSGPGGSQFMDDSLVPNSLAACYPTGDEAVAAARKLYRLAGHDRERWVFLLAALLGEG